MFSRLLRDLHEIYSGNEIYIPDALYPLVRGWFIQKYGQGQHISLSANIKYRGKVVLPYDEDKQLVAYQSTPIHLPERILEKSIVIEASLVQTEVAEEPVKKRTPRPSPPRQTSTYKPVKRRPSFK